MYIIIYDTMWCDMYDMICCNIIYPFQTQQSFTYLLTYLFTYFLIYLLTPCSRVLLEKLAGSQLVMKVPEFYCTLKFITLLTIARHLSLS